MRLPWFFPKTRALINRINATMDRIDVEREDYRLLKSPYPTRFTDKELEGMKRMAPGLYEHVMAVRKFEAKKRN